MPAYLIHIGPPKTASTLLQRGFAALRATLRDAGIIYPDTLGSPGHADLPLLLRTPARLTGLFDTLNAIAGGTVLLSAEGLAATAPAPLRRLTAGNPATIVYYCRSWADLLRSRWGERIRHGETVSLHTWCAAALDQPLSSRAINYARVLDRWAEAFGHHALRLVSLEALDASNTDPAAHFHATFLGRQHPPSPTRINPAPPLIYTELLRAVNAATIDLLGRPDPSVRRAFLRDPETPALATTRDAIARELTTVTIDETLPGLTGLHAELWRRYGSRLVAPSLGEGFFTPRSVCWLAAESSYQHRLEVREYVQGALPLDPAKGNAFGNRYRVSSRAL